jgi:Ca2+-binding EF-hand superfamily protein
LCNAGIKQSLFALIRCLRCFPSGTGKVNFDGFCRIAAHFLEEEDSEAMQEELKEAFRLYDREGKFRINGKL